MKALRLGLLGLGLLATEVWLAAAPRVGAQTVFNWDPPPHANVFSTATNWTPAGPPGTTGEARFNTSASAYSVSFNTDPINARVRVGNDHATFDLNGHTYTLTTTSTSSPSIMVGGITLADDALLTVTDGTLAGQHAVIAPAIFQTAAGMVVSTGGTLNLAGTFTIGKQLPGSLTVQNGGDVTSATGVLGESGNGNGLVTVTGDGSTWHNFGNVYVGGQAAIDGGNGTLSITNQGLVDVDGTLKLWPGGSVALNGGTLETANMELAGGAFNWTAGTLHLGSDLIVDPSGLLGGSAAVGAGKTLEVDSALYVGNTGNGTLEITGGSNVVGGFPTFIGLESGATGEATVDGTGTFWNSGGLSVGDHGNGTLNIRNGARVISSNASGLGGSNGNGMAVVDGTDSRWNVSGQLTIGSSGEGALEIKNGGLVTGSSVVIGNSFTATGVVHVDGPSLLGVTNTLVVGQQGLGILRITNGGQAISTSGKIGNLPGLEGQVYVDGPGSKWTFAAGNSLYVGDSGEGTLNITNGGLVQGGYVILGFDAFSGATGTFNVDGSTSSLQVQSNLEIANGVATLSNGGTISASTILIGAVGELAGTGNVVGDVKNYGLVSPGTSPGALNVDGDYTQTATGELLIELASASSYDQLLITSIPPSVATLDGTLTVDLLGGFMPSVGQSFTILTAGFVAGTFATETLPSVPGRIFDVIYNPQSVVLTVLPAFTADFDEDGDVDAADLAQWQGDFGVNALSDADNDGDSDGADFLAWQQQFGSPPPPSGAVPEPTAITLILLVGCGSALVRSLRR